MNHYLYKSSLIFLDLFPEDKQQNRGVIKGELKLSIEYNKGALNVMVHHAKNLSMPDGSKEEPNSYVKVIIN